MTVLSDLEVRHLLTIGEVSRPFPNSYPSRNSLFSIRFFTRKWWAPRDTNPKMANLFLSLNRAILGFATITRSQIVVETPRRPICSWRKGDWAILGVSTTIWDHVIVINPKWLNTKRKNKWVILGFASHELSLSQLFVPFFGSSLDCTSKIRPKY